MTSNSQPIVLSAMKCGREACVLMTSAQQKKTAAANFGIAGHIIFGWQAEPSLR